uniref:ADP-ribosyl cyclase/cyclic ADP-ribose hydrolase n=1 Tax=Salix viminalis TaxID=40686 RepID=A0A6N2L4P0_SALVM
MQETHNHVKANKLPALASGIPDGNAKSALVHKLPAHHLFLLDGDPMVTQIRGEGIKACKDDEMLIGEDISPALVDAIEQSRASIVILSPNYVNSTWCSEELVKEHIILPVCYGVDPSEKQKRGTYYKDAFARHELKHGMETGGGLLRQWLIMLDVKILPKPQQKHLGKTSPHIFSAILLSMQTIVLRIFLLYNLLNSFLLSFVPKKLSTKKASSLLPPPSFVLTRMDQAELKRVFQMLDRNGDGKITKKELKIFENQHLIHEKS